MEKRSLLLLPRLLHVPTAHVSPAHSRTQAASLKLVNELELVNGYVNSYLSPQNKQKKIFFFDGSLETPEVVKLKKERVVMHSVECHETLLAF